MLNSTRQGVRRILQRPRLLSQTNQNRQTKLIYAPLESPSVCLLHIAGKRDGMLGKMDEHVQLFIMLGLCPGHRPNPMLVWLCGLVTGRNILGAALPAQSGDYMGLLLMLLVCRFLFKFISSYQIKSNQNLHTSD